MLFNSFEFFLFFPIVTILYFLLPHRFRWLHLLVSSCVFYMALIPVYILILFFTIIVDYFAGILIEGAEGKNKKKKFLVLSLISNIGILAVFKYYNFFIENINLTGAALPLLKIALPVGLSFHTFQAMSYTIEVYRGHQRAERHFGIYALYVMFYPQLVAGPIERPQNLLPQFHEKKYFNYDNVVSGLRLMLWGLFKKVVIADRLALIVDPIYNHPYNHRPAEILFATFIFCFQVFCDFSGYSDIAIGAARVMGFRLMTNFNRPYSSKSFHEFWTRWHISLSTWFRDYLYIPLGGNKVAVPRWYLNIFIVFLISGLWHGANWTFIVWGGIHAFYSVFGAMTRKWRQKASENIGLTKLPGLYGFIQKATTFLLLMVSLVFFRGPIIKDDIYMMKQLLPGVGEFFSTIGREGLGYINPDWWYALGLIAVLEFVHYLQGRGGVVPVINKRPVYFRWALYYSLILIIIFLGVFDDRQFIYFQF